MNFQISSTRIHTHPTTQNFLNPAQEKSATERPAQEKSAVEKPAQESPAHQDKISFSRNTIPANTTMQTLNLGEEDANMSKISSFSKAESLASAHSPISYERVMQLLED